MRIYVGEKRRGDLYVYKLHDISKTFQTTVNRVGGLGLGRLKRTGRKDTHKELFMITYRATRHNVRRTVKGKKKPTI
jgi:hypothetical protein